MSKNSLFVIEPYRAVGTWVFDDERVGLYREPFVLGVPEIIDMLLMDEQIKNAASGFRLVFSTSAFPGYQTVLRWEREELGGNWYLAGKYCLHGWLCPALFKYFDKTPRKIFVKAESL